MRRLAHLSDLHYGADPETQPKLFEGLLEAFAGQQVDALVFTGDVFDSNEPSPGLVEGFVGLHAGLITSTVSSSNERKFTDGHSRGASS